MQNHFIFSFSLCIPQLEKLYADNAVPFVQSQSSDPLTLIGYTKQWPRSRKVNITITRAPYFGCQTQCWGLKLVFYLIVFFHFRLFKKKKKNNNLYIYSIYFNVNKRSANVKLKICHVTELATSVNEVHHNMKE